MSLPPLITELSHGTESRLAIRLSPGSSALYKTIGNPHTSPGRILSGRNTSIWSWNGLMEHEAWLYLSFSPGPDQDSKSLSSLDSLFYGSADHTLSVISTYLRRLAVLKDSEGLEIDGSLLRGTFINHNEQFYLLHQRLCQIMDRELHDEYIPSGVSGEREFVYRLLRKIYSCLILNESQRTALPPAADRMPAVHPRESLPSLKENVSDTILHALILEDIPCFDEIITRVDSWIKNGLFDDINSREKNTRQQNARASSIKTQRKLRGAVLWKKYRSAIIFTAAGITALSLFIAPLIRKSLETDITEGLGPREIVQLFYESENSLDHEMMQKCTIKKTGSSHLNQVTTLFVISRVRQGIEMKNYFVSAPDWISEGKPPLSEGYFVFGNTDLNIVPLPGDSQFLVEYTRWTTIPSDASDPADEDISDPGSEKEIQSFRVKEKIYLRETRKGWKIETIEETERTLLM